MPPYEEAVLRELSTWRQRMLRRPSAVNRLSKALQTRMNRIIPEKFHQAITATIKQMTRAVLFGAEFLTRLPVEGPLSLEEREDRVRARIDFYKTAGAAEGGLTGAAGLLLGLADFPLFLALKMKLLFEIASLYGYSVNDYRERLYIMHIFQLAFSSQERRREVYLLMTHWQARSQELPDDIHQFDWRTFQQEYRDYIDLAKMAQLIPGIGAAVGLVVNYRMIDALGKTAMNAYRMRWAESRALKESP
ncbi:EcsC family protein [Larkinella soli]|uniref:EcsC family protein n=1 Tax=Larkinella soli TaxID=1770527 RepID=UPI000FFC991A|nr:EcsC family protein [Larkinella soli]